MTRHGKCETCRKRKVKCDEKWPMCGPCSIKRRPCHYVESVFVHDRSSPGQTAVITPADALDTIISNRKPSEQAPCTLRLKRHHKAKAGQGEFLTFEPVKPSSPSPVRASSPPSIDLGSVFGHEALELSPLGPWVHLAQQRSGENPCLELALQYTLQCMIAFQQSHSEESVKRASRIGVRALRSLQSSIESSQDHDDKLSVVYAIMLHYAAEGICQLLNSYFKDQPDHDGIQSIVDTICCHEVITAIHFGETSQLESIARPPVDFNTSSQVDIAKRGLVDLMIQLPRLVCYVRDCTEGLVGLAEAIEVVNLLRDSAEDQCARETLATVSWTTTSLSSETKSPTGTVLAFESMDAFFFAKRYYSYRLLIGGLLVTLATIADDKDLLAEAEYIELDAATSVAECLDFALKPGPTQSLTCLALIAPLELSLGAWDRLQQRETSFAPEPHSLKYRQAVQMKDWCIENLQGICQRWRAGSIPRDRMETMYGAFVGGPLMDGPDSYMRVDY
ncbi:hypothetical protein PRZ48_014860 [Zasmidium cellare]|uniref:Zn(2)-C6 fungal-type domain-containing protein n=1 Tax=Zasmidium cellare TaxID=395010 RepID=A0ABR0DXE0_ZASCE|nr:hypothetical protein PRZ48_014860 [Zasmidium cellare]